MVNTSCGGAEGKRSGVQSVASSVKNKSPRVGVAGGANNNNGG